MSFGRTKLFGSLEWDEDPPERIEGVVSGVPGIRVPTELGEGPRLTTPDRMPGRVEGTPGGRGVVGGTL